MVDCWEGSDEQFVLMCLYYLTEKNDPTRYCDWNEARFKRLEPHIYALWVNREKADELLWAALEERA